MFYCWLSCLCFFIFFFPFPSGCSEGSSGVEGARNACPLSLMCWNSLFLVRNTAWQELQTVFSGSSPASPIWNGWERKDIWRIYRISPIWKQIFLGIVGNLKTRSNIVGWMSRLLRSESCHSGNCTELMVNEIMSRAFEKLPVYFWQCCMLSITIVQLLCEL